MRQEYLTKPLLEKMGIYSIPPFMDQKTHIKPLTVFLTGGTGFLGSHVLFYLLKKGIKVYCLVRASDNTSAYERIVEALKGFPLTSCEISNIQCVLHDKWEDFTASFDCLIHTAGNISLSSSFDQSFSDNVILTQNMYKLAHQHHAHMVHVSSLSVLVSSDLPSGALYPKAQLSCIQKTHGVYATTKFLAEAFLLNHQTLPLSVYRLGQLASTPFKLASSDPLWHIIDAFAQDGFPCFVRPCSYHKTDLLDTNHVAKFIVDNLTTPKIYHIASPVSLSSQEMFECLTQSFPKSLNGATSNQTAWNNHKKARRALLRYSDNNLFQKYPYWDVFQSSRHSYEKTPITQSALSVFEAMIQYYKSTKT